MAAPKIHNNADTLLAAGLPAKDVRAWWKGSPRKIGSLAADRKTFGAYWQNCARLLSRLPPQGRRDAREDVAARLIRGAAIDARTRFLRAHADTVYDKLTANRSHFVRIEQLVV